jgi:hypothetical protein
MGSGTTATEQGTANFKDDVVLIPLCLKPGSSLFGSLLWQESKLKKAVHGI